MIVAKKQPKQDVNEPMSLQETIRRYGAIKVPIHKSKEPNATHMSTAKYSPAGEDGIRCAGPCFRLCSACSCYNIPFLEAKKYKTCIKCREKAAKQREERKQKVLSEDLHKVAKACATNPIILAEFDYYLKGYQTHYKTLIQSELPQVTVTDLYNGPCTDTNLRSIGGTHDQSGAPTCPNNI